MQAAIELWLIVLIWKIVRRFSRIAICKTLENCSNNTKIQQFNISHTDVLSHF